MTTQQIKQIMLSLIDIPKHKILYLIIQPDYVKGIWDTLDRYNIQHTQENHELLVELVQGKFEGPDIEREWTEREYETFVKFNG